MGKYDSYTVEGDEAASTQAGKYSGYTTEPASSEARAVVEDWRNSMPIGTAPDANLAARAFRSIDNGVRAMANRLTFGGADALERNFGGIGGGGGAATDEWTKDAANMSPVATTVGDIGSMAALGGGISSGLKMAAPGVFARNTIPAIAGREALAGAAADGIDAVGNRGGDINPYSMGLSALLGGGGAAAFTGAARALSPEARFRSYGNDLSTPEKDAAMELARRSGDVGVPLNAAEAIAATTPGKSAGIIDNFNTAAQSRGGSRVARNAEADRRSGLEAAGRRVQEAVGNGVDPFDAARSAESAIQSQRDIVRGSAQPYFNAADPMPLPPRRFLEPADRAAARDVLDSEIVRDRIQNVTGTDSHHTVAFRDAQMKSARAMADRAEAQKQNGIIRSEFGNSADRIENFIAGNNQDYSIARGIERAGAESVERLETGPLGVIAANPGNTKAQGAALFGSTNAVEARAAENAARRLAAEDINAGRAAGATPRGILSNRLDDAISVTPENPRGFGSALPTGHAEDTMRAVTGQMAGPIEDSIRAGRAVRETPPNNFSGDNVGPVSEAYRLAREYGREGVMKLFQDPDNIRKLGETGPGQELLQFLLTGATTTGSGRAVESRQRSR